MFYIIKREEKQDETIRDLKHVWKMHKDAIYALIWLFLGFVIAFSELFVTFAYKKVLAYLLPSGFAPDGLVQLLSTDYKFAVSFVILLIVLLFKPTGLFKGKSV